MFTFEARKTFKSDTQRSYIHFPTLYGLFDFSYIKTSLRAPAINGNPLDYQVEPAREAGGFILNLT